MTLRQAILAALRGDADLLPTIARSLRQRFDDKDENKMTTVVQAANALEPIIADAVKRKPSKLGMLGLKSTHLLASLASEDEESNGRLAAIARNQIVGIVFVDVAGFTQYTSENGDDAAIALLTKLSDLTGKTTGECKGEVVKSLGDGYLLAFPSASQAVRGAVNLRDRALALRTSDPSFVVSLRVAIHAGEPLIEGDDLLGHDVNLTARLLDVCEPDEVVVSEAAKAIAEKRLKKITFSGKRSVKIKGLMTKVTVFTVNPIPSKTVRSLKKLVGA